MRELTQKEVKCIAAGKSERLANEGALLGMMTGGWLGYELIKSSLSVSYLASATLFCAYVGAVTGGFLSATLAYREEDYRRQNA